MTLLIRASVKASLECKNLNPPESYVPFSDSDLISLRFATCRSTASDEYAFYVQCAGQIDSGKFGSNDNLYCRYSFSFGHDWVVASVS